MGSFTYNIRNNQNNAGLDLFPREISKRETMTSEIFVSLSRPRSEYRLRLVCPRVEFFCLFLIVGVGVKFELSTDNIPKLEAANSRTYLDFFYNKII